MNKSSEQKRCPVPGCNMVFATPGARGWHSHVRRVEAHPFWHPEAKAGNLRQSLFVEEFPSFFPPEPEPEVPLASEELPVLTDMQVIRAFVESLRTSLKSLDRWVGPAT